MKSEVLQKQEARFMEKLQSIDRTYEAYAKAKGLSYMSLEILEYILEYPDNCTQKRICALTHYPKQSVNLVIKSFWQDGYVELNECSADRRNKRILLTERGKKYAGEMVAPLWRADEKATKALSDSERDILLRLLEKYEIAFKRELAPEFCEDATAASEDS